MSNPSHVHTSGSTSSMAVHESPHRGGAGAENQQHAVGRNAALRIAAVAAAAGLVWLHVWEPFDRVSVIGLTGALIGLYPILKEAATDVYHRRMTMELSMTIAILAALAIGQFFTALVIILFVLIAEVLEGLTVRHGRMAIRELLNLLAQEVTVRRNGRAEQLPTDAVQIGEVIEINPGARIPVDGDVVGGNSFVDQATITGESLSVEKVPGTSVYAGTINQSGALEVRVTEVGRDTAFGHILNAVEEAERSRAPIQKTADRLAGYLVWFALGCAPLTLAVTHNLTSTISAIIVAGACGIAAGTPLAILGGIGRSARQGAIVKGGLYLELLSSVDTVVFDKKGALTFGNPEITSIIPAEGHTELEVLKITAIAEQRSEHPLSKAIVKKAAEAKLAVPAPKTFQYFPGKGISVSLNHDQILVGSKAFLAENQVAVAGHKANGNDSSHILVASNGKYVGAIEIADTLRSDARDAVRALHTMGLPTVLLTGDARKAAESIAQEVGIDVVHAEVLPDQKSQIVKQFVADGKRVAMVGDGINDAPALAQAQVGIAMGTGTDVAMESAGVTLVKGDLRAIARARLLSRATMRNIKQNLFFAFVYNSIGVPIAVGVLYPFFGLLLSPIIAAAAMSFSSVSVVTNALRLRKAPI